MIATNAKLGIHLRRGKAAKGQLLVIRAAMSRMTMTVTTGLMKSGMSRTLALSVLKTLFILAAMVVTVNWLSYCFPVRPNEIVLVWGHDGCIFSCPI